MTSEDVVKLNIGGTIFETTRSTLTKYDGYFRGMFESGITPTLDESGSIFIDRSAKHFDLVLNFLRDGKTSIPESKFEMEQLVKEAEYYMLEGLIHLCGGGGETSDESKKVTLKYQHLRDWRGANLRAEVQFTEDEKELTDFKVYGLGKYRLLLISYTTLFWGDIHENHLISNFVRKHSGTWNIIFYACKRSFPHYSVHPLTSYSICSRLSNFKFPEATVEEFLEKIETDMRKLSPN